jgi:hypothetical protein
MVNVPFIKLKLGWPALFTVRAGSAKMSESQVETASRSFIFRRWGEALSPR